MATLFSHEVLAFIYPSLQIPDFAGFWILSVFIQTPLQMYLMTSEQILKYKTSTITQATQCLLLFLQIASSFTAIRRASRFRREQFQNEKALFDMERRPNQTLLDFVRSVQIIDFEKLVQVIKVRTEGDQKFFQSFHVISIAFRWA